MRRINFCFILFSFLILHSCSKNNEIECPKKVAEILECERLNTAKWMIYKLNLLKGEKYHTCNFSSKQEKSKYLKSNLYGLNLELSDFQKNIDGSVMFLLPFAENICPEKAPYFLSITFSTNDTIEASTGRYFFPISIEEGEEEFQEYLQSKEPSELNPWLLQEARKRGVLK